MLASFTSNDLESQSQQKRNPSAIQLNADRLQAEGQINRLKTIKRAIYGRAGPELLRARVLPLDQNRHHTK
ncbi:transposase [Sinorhizobium meliloti CCNWSX0020]|uniref:Transposase n=1 Tax=Sinorhizobium meliloti CCNWSX0020 TaxID=1107881 RepID=H0FVV0_RHIML|nr:transposase [Sinorhizobium meliloti CCNWSX0020]